MDNIKISVTFSIPGNVMYSDKECAEDFEKYSIKTVGVYDSKKNKTEFLKSKVRKCKPCKQIINMSQEAYDCMMDTPANSSKNHWKRMSEKQRIAEHLKDMQYQLHATSFEFTIFND